MLFPYYLETPITCCVKSLLVELPFHLKTQLLETRTWTFPGCHFKIKFLSLTVAGRELKMTVVTEILWYVPSHLIDTWHNYIWCWQLTLNKLVNAYAIKRKGFGDNSIWIHGPASLAFKEF